MVTKICGRCKLEKNVDMFGHSAKNKTGLRSTCNDCRKIESKIYREKNKEKRKNTIRKYYNNNKELLSKKQKEYKEKNYEKWKRIKINSFHKNKKKNADRIKELRKLRQHKRTEYQRNKINTDLIYKLSAICRTRIHHFIKKTNLTKKGKSFEMIGCTPTELKNHLEKQFRDGMCWDKFGKEIHIDHIIPLSTAKTEDELYKLCHYTNLQPLWAHENLIKGCQLTSLQSVTG